MFRRAEAAVGISANRNYLSLYIHSIYHRSRVCMNVGTYVCMQTGAGAAVVAKWKTIRGTFSEEDGWPDIVVKRNGSVPSRLRSHLSRLC